MVGSFTFRPSGDSVLFGKNWITERGFLLTVQRVVAPQYENSDILASTISESTTDGHREWWFSQSKRF
jgi:hypothetical protein